MSHMTLTSRISNNLKGSASDSSTPTTTMPNVEIVAYSQQRHFYRENFDTNSTDIDLKGVNVSVNNKKLLVDAHLRLKYGVQYIHTVWLAKKGQENQASESIKDITFQVYASSPDVCP